MTTQTLRQSHACGPDWTDLIASIPGAANADGFVKHQGGDSVHLILGGADRPDKDHRGIPLFMGGEEWSSADHIWARCPFGGSATLGFSLVS